MWYYAIESEKHGPFDDSAFDALIENGTISSSTYVWKDGMSDWAPLSQVRPMNVTVPASGLPPAIRTIWQDGGKVVARNETSLPHRCFKCNHEVTTPPLKRKFMWHPGAFYILILLGLLIYIIVAIFVRKTATLDIYLCGAHQKRRKYFIIGGWSGSLLGFALITVGIGMNAAWLIVLGITLFPIALFAGMFGARVASTSQIKDDKVWLTGAGKEFIASLPPLS